MTETRAPHPASTLEVHPGRLGRDTWVMTRRNLLRYVRLPQLLAFSIVQPIMFLLLFTYVFGGAIGSEIPPAAEIGRAHV